MKKTTITNVGRATYNYRVKTDSAEAEGQIVLTVTPRPVTLTSPTASREYDGTPLTAKDVIIGGQGFVNDEGVNFNVTGSQTYEGTTDNTFTYTWKDGTDKNNYTVTVVRQII